MQNTIKKFRQSSNFFEKRGILSENLKTLTNSNNPTKGCVGFYLDLELFAKIKKDLVSTHSFFTLLLITQDLNKIKNPTHPFVDITK